MNPPQFYPHAIAVFWDRESAEFQKTIPKAEYISYWNRFFSSIRVLLPGGVVFSNIQIPYLSEIQAQNESFPIRCIESDTEIRFFQLLLPELPPRRIGSEDWDEVCFLYFSGVAPLLDPDLCQEFWNRHVRYFSQYSYSENLPEGIIPKVLTREFLNSLPASLNVSSHDFFLKNINNYDVEIFFKKPDLRQYRLSLVPNSPRSYHLIHTILQKMENSSFSWKYENLQNFILANPESIRLSPAWIELEIYRGCELTCTFCPRQYIDNARDGNLLTKEDIRKIVQERNRLRGEVTYCLGGMGEPLLHPDLESVLRELLQTNELKEIIIETALYTDWSVQEQKIINLYKELSDLSRKKIQFIINFTTLSEKSYKNLYGENKLELVKENLKRLSEIIPKSQISVQILKIQETEEETEKYFNHFEKEGFPIVFQKYNRYITLMPEKRVSDLTPLIREFCWHLGRDLYIEADGTIKLCKQGILNVSPVLGNIRNEDLISIWERGLTYFEKTLKGEHQNIPMPCLQCDEWYTFNA